MVVATLHSPEEYYESGNANFRILRFFCSERRSETLTAVTMNIAVLWNETPCSLVEMYRCRRGPSCLHE